MACAASLRVAARGGPTVHRSARSFEDTGAPFRRQHLFRSSSPSPRDRLDDLEAQAAFDCNHSSSRMESWVAVRSVFMTAQAVGADVADASSRTGRAWPSP